MARLSLYVYFIAYVIRGGNYDAPDFTMRIQYKAEIRFNLRIIEIMNACQAYLFGGCE